MITLDNYLRPIIKHPKLIVLGYLGLLLLLLAGLPRLDFTNNFRVYFDKQNPQLADLDALEETYQRQENLRIYLNAGPQNSMFSLQNLQIINAMTQASWQVPYSIRVDSIANYTHTEVQGDDFVSGALLEHQQLDEARAKDVERIVYSKEDLVNYLISANGQLAVVQISLQMPVEKKHAPEEAMDYVRAMVADYQQRHPHLKYQLGGYVAANLALGEAVARDASSLIPLTYLLIVVVLFLLIRNFSGLVATGLLISLAIMLPVGIYCWANITFTPVIGFVPTVIATVSIADSIHILVNFYHAHSRGLSKAAAIRESVDLNFKPILITSITTIIGVLCLNFSDSPPYRDLGNMVAIGVAAAFVLSVSLLPALLLWLPVGNSRSSQRHVETLEQLGRWVVKRRKPLLLGTGLLTILLASQLPRNSIQETWYEYFDDTFEIRRVIELSDRMMNGADVIEYNLDSGQPWGISNPDYLRQVDAFADWFESQPGVNSILKFPSTIRTLNQLFNQDQAEFNRIPDNAELVSQYLLFHEMSLGYGQGLENRVKNDHSATRFTVFLHKANSKEVLELDQRAQAWLAANAPDILPSKGTGLSVVMKHISQRNSQSLVYGSLFALVLISICLVVALKSWRYGLISLIPNLTPAVFAFGYWALVSGEINLAVSIVLCLSLGIVVDDSVHFLSKYQRALKAGQPPEQAVLFAFKNAGSAISLTTMILVGGFVIMASSHFTPTQEVGELMAITLTSALFVDLLLLPPLLLLLDKKAQRSRAQPTHESASPNNSAIAPPVARQNKIDKKIEASTESSSVEQNI